ncbi:MAG: 4Fe-4S binding protein [Chloroflexi bacterium]|nr:4Fe-4S binding protein [Chloroflexota bacterium]
MTNFDQQSTVQNKFQTRQRRERIFLIASILIVVAAWFYGYYANGIEITPLVPDVLPGTEYIETQGDLFIGYAADNTIVGYAAAGEGAGYSGPIKILVGVDPSGAITGVKTIKQRETPSFFRLVMNANILADMIDKQVSDPFQLGEDINAVSGATLSVEGIAASTREAIRIIARKGLDQSGPAEIFSFKFGIPEITLILLFAAGYFGHKMSNSAWKRRTRWASLLTGMVVLGFIYTAPFTITMVVSLLSGYWPDWHNNLYWYLLIGGILFVTTVNAKNPYCHWFCPFGAVQECVGLITKPKSYRPRNYITALKWFQRGLTLAAVVLGLILRRPGVAGYEPFATLFDFEGTGIQWAFLALILIASLIVYRPFCSYLCPLDAVVDLIGAIRKWMREVKRKWQNQNV